MFGKRKILFDDVLFNLSYIVISIVFFLVAYNTVQQNEINKISNDFYSENSIHFLVKSEDKSNPFPSLVNSENDLILYKDIDKDFKGVFLTGYTVNPPILQGRYFEKKDFNSNKKVAVVGKSVMTEEKDGKTCVMYMESCFEIIGVMGSNQVTRLDSKIFLNLDGLNTVSSTTTDGLYVLDGYSGIRDSFSEWISKIEKDVVIKELNIETRGLDRFFGNQANQTFTQILYGLTIIITGIIVTNFWMSKRRKLISVQYLIGHQTVFIYSSIYKKYFLMLTSSYIFGVIIMGLFHLKYLILHIREFSYMLLSSYLILQIFGSFLFIIFIKKYSVKKSLKMLRS